MRNARLTVFRAPWIPSPSQRLAAFRAEYDRHYPRPGPRQRGYDHAWDVLRAQHLVAEPACRKCGAAGRIVAARIVDHIVPIRRAPERRLDPTNLQSLCASCHQSKTGREHGNAARTAP